MEKKIPIPMMRMSLKLHCLEVYECFSGGKKGHMSKDCWFKEEKKNNSPCYWKEPGEQNAVGMDESRVEYLF